MSHRSFNLWSYVDARDAGEACRLAVEADLPGHARMVIAAADTLMPEDSAALMRRYFPEVPMAQPLPGNAALLSCAFARESIGYAARHSWRESGGRGRPAG
ncbi:MAG: hypothetical protein KGZ61_08170 [Sandarakinorhabdus sp.]|nr:hypothetical protein [Sandarakinorhabdus sp.]